MPQRKTKLSPPLVSEVRAARLAAGLSQTQAAQLMSSGSVGDKAYRTWQRYEAEDPAHPESKIPSVTWELFLLLTDQHPAHRLAARRLTP